MAGTNRPSRQRSNCKRKAAYFSVEEAQIVAEEVRAAGKLKGEEVAVYECHICGHFHWGNMRRAA